MRSGGRDPRGSGGVPWGIGATLALFLAVGSSACIDWMLPEVLPDSAVDSGPDADGDTDTDVDSDTDTDSDIDSEADTTSDGGDGDVPLPQLCGDAGVCETGHCVDGYCCDSACRGEVCQRCDDHSVRGAGRCGHVGSSTVDPDDECSTAPAPSPGSCRSENCSGTSYSCGFLPAGEHGQTECLRCSGRGEDPVRVANDTQDGEGVNLCNEPCRMCFAGECTNQRRGMDIAGQCGTGSCCDASAGCVVDPCSGGWFNESWGDRDCDECTDEHCWSAGYCAQLLCEYMETFGEVMCRCSLRSEICDP